MTTWSETHSESNPSASARVPSDTIDSAVAHGRAFTTCIPMFIATLRGWRATANGRGAVDWGTSNRKRVFYGPSCLFNPSIEAECSRFGHVPPFDGQPPNSVWAPLLRPGLDQHTAPRGAL